MNQRKAKKINRLASKLIQSNPEKYKDETILHGYRSIKVGYRTPITQRISGKRKAKREALSSI